MPDALPQQRACDNCGARTGFWDRLCRYGACLDCFTIGWRPWDD